MTTEIPFPRDEIIFSAVPNLTTCTRTTIVWTYSWPFPPRMIYPLVVTNIGVDQGGLRRRDYPLVPRQGTAVVNMTLANINAGLERVDWTQVNVPQGRYRLDFYALTRVLSSNVFTVTNGPDMSCLVAVSQPPTLPSSTQQLPSSTPPSSTPSSTPSTNASSSIPVAGGSSVNKGVIAGAVIGGVGVLALIALLVLWVSRRRNSRARNATPPGFAPRTRGQGSRRFNSSDSTGAILPISPQLSESDFDHEKSAVAYHNTSPDLAITVPIRSYSKSSTSSKRPASMTVQPSFESRETVQSRQSRILRRSLDGGATPPDKATFPPSPSSPSRPRHPSDRTRRGSRKAVPAYDESEFSGFGSNDIPLAGRSETKFGRKVYYITPDVPLDRRN